MSGEHRAAPITSGRKFGLGVTGRLPNVREHCKRCAEITDAASQMVSRYIIANGNQVEIINRLLANPDQTKEVVWLGQLVSERDSFIDALAEAARTDTDQAIRMIAEWKAEHDG